MKNCFSIITWRTMLSWTQREKLLSGDDNAHSLLSTGRPIGVVFHSQLFATHELSALFCVIKFNWITNRNTNYVDYERIMNLNLAGGAFVAIHFHFTWETNLQIITLIGSDYCTIRIGADWWIKNTLRNWTLIKLFILIKTKSSETFLPFD